MSAHETHTCPECHATSNIHTHRITPGLVGALVKFRRAIYEHQRNSIHLYKDMGGQSFELTTTEQMNWTKLRFHGLVAKVKEDGQVQRGYWLLTKRGRLFLDGDISVPVKVRTMNNRVLHDDEPQVSVTVTEVTQTKPAFDDWTFWHSSIERIPLELPQTTMELGV